MRARRVLSPGERAELLLAPTVSLQEAASILGVGATALRDSLRRGEVDLPLVSVGSRRVVPTAALRRLLGEAEVNA